MSMAFHHYGASSPMHHYGVEGTALYTCFFIKGGRMESGRGELGCGTRVVIRGEKLRHHYSELWKKFSFSSLNYNIGRETREIEKKYVKL